jgi:tetratricopeptide (TPR) repeat protein
VALLGAGGGAFVVVQRRNGNARAPVAPVAVTPHAEVEAAQHEAALAIAVRKLQNGQAAQVAAELSGSFDEAHDAAPFRAYVLSLAHLQLGDVEEAADWFLVAARLYPEFARELAVNDSLKELRVHARVRGFLEEAARTGGLPPDVRGVLGLVEDSVAYV